MNKLTIVLVILIGFVLIFLISKTSEIEFINKFFGKEKVRQSKKIIKKKRIYSHKDLKSDNFDRYILIKGKNLKSVESKLKDYGELAAKGNSYTYNFSKSKIGDWTIIKMPSDFKDFYEYHNIVYWFLGFPPEDENYADYSIGLSINESLSYAIYNDYKLQKMLRLEDELLGVFDNDEKFILSIPFDKFKESTNKHIRTFNSLFSDNEIDINLIRNKKINFVKFGILFNEK